MQNIFPSFKDCFQLTQITVWLVETCVCRNSYWHNWFVRALSLHKRERGFTPVMSVTKLSSLCKCLASKKFGSTVAMCLPARVATRSSTQKTASTYTISLCVTRFTTGRVVATSPFGASTTIDEIILNLNVWGGGGEEEDCSGQLQEEGRHPLASQMEIYCVGF